MKKTIRERLNLWTDFFFSKIYHKMMWNFRLKFISKKLKETVKENQSLKYKVNKKKLSRKVVSKI